MFVRFRETKNFREARIRLRVSLVETRRMDGKVRNEHIASLGSVPMPPEVDDRLAFWKRLHERLANLDRVNGGMQAKILEKIHVRIPMAMPDEHALTGSRLTRPASAGCEMAGTPAD
jgi:hypothetical protein